MNDRYQEDLGDDETCDDDGAEFPRVSRINWDEPGWEDCEYSRVRKPQRPDNLHEHHTADHEGYDHLQVLEDLLAEIAPLAKEHVGYVREAGSGEIAAVHIKNAMALSGGVARLVTTIQGHRKSMGRRR